MGVGAPGLSERARDRLACAGPAGVAFVVYLWTACRTVYVGDSGELATVCATFGIPHPSGYPLYALAGGVFVRLFPIGSSLAFRANAFSGACAAAAVATCAALVLDLARGPDGTRPRGARAAAVGAGALLAFSATFWQEATVARVYGLNAWLSLATIRAGLAWARDGDPRGATRTSW